MNENIKVTEKLIRVIRYERSHKKISAQDLSIYINKSKTYISTLERNKIEVLKGDLLYTIFEKINNSSDKELCNFINNIIGKLYIGIIPQKRIEFLNNEKWILQLCLVLNKIPLNDSIIEFINTSLIQCNKTTLDLTRKINENLILNDTNMDEVNTLYVDDTGSWNYRFEISENIITDILDKNVSSTNYVTLFAIISNILLFKAEENILSKTKSYLNENRFYDVETLANLENMNYTITKNLGVNSYSFNLPTLDNNFNNNLKSIKDIILNLKNINYDLAEKIVTTTEKNLSEDIEFMSVFYSIPFHLIFKNLRKEKKQDFLNSLSELITKFSNNSKL